VSQIIDDPSGQPVLFPNGVGVTGSFYGATIPGPDPLSPGSIVTLFGSNLASDTVSAQSLPLPTTLLDTSVTFNGIPANLFMVSPDEIRAQAPVELQKLSPPASIQVQVQHGSSTTAPLSVQIASVSPKILTAPSDLCDSAYSGIVSHADGRPVTYLDPALPGESIVIYATGLGPLQQSIPSGAAPDAPVPVLRSPTVNFTDFYGNVLFYRDATYAGAVAGFPGLYQVNVTVPDTLHNSVMIELGLSGLSNRVTLSVKVN